jgi:hypothetical protein
MEKAIKEKFLIGIAKKYEKADRASRSELLDQIVARFEVHRKSAIRVLRSYLSPQSAAVKPVKKAKSKVTKKVSSAKTAKSAKVSKVTKTAPTVKAAKVTKAAKK